LITKKKMKTDPTWFLWLHCLVNSTASFIAVLFTKVNSFFFEKLVNSFFFFEKPVQLIDFTHTIHVNVNNNFYFFKKISLR
jgi:hypothetical protein